LNNFKSENRRLRSSLDASEAKIVRQEKQLAAGKRTETEVREEIKVNLHFL